MQLQGIICMMMQSIRKMKVVSSLQNIKQERATSILANFQAYQTRKLPNLTATSLLRYEWVANESTEHLYFFILPSWFTTAELTLKIFIKLKRGWSFTIWHLSSTYPPTCRIWLLWGDWWEVYLLCPFYNRSQASPNNNYLSCFISEVKVWFLPKMYSFIPRYPRTYGCLNSSGKISAALENYMQYDRLTIWRVKLDCVTQPRCSKSLTFSWIVGVFCFYNMVTHD